MVDATSLPWGFYGRSRELGQLRSILEPQQWFFLKVAGRRRIGKTELVRHALGREAQKRVVYIQIPDSDPAGVVSTASTLTFPLDGHRRFNVGFLIEGQPPAED